MMTKSDDSLLWLSLMTAYYDQVWWQPIMTKSDDSLLWLSLMTAYDDKSDDSLFWPSLKQQQD